MNDSCERPILRKVPDVELLKVGEWPLSTGTVEFTAADLAAAVRASQSPSVSRPVIKLGHTDPRFDGEPAVGWVDNMRLSDDGSTLMGDLCGLPGWLADIMPSAYPNRSIEGFFNYRDQSGAVHDFALTGLALLGVSPPAVGTLSSLRDVAALYEVEAKANSGRDGPEKGIRVMPEKLLASASVEDMRRNFYEQGPGKDTFLWIEEIFLEPPEVIAMDDETSELKKIPFTVSEDSISWGEAETVKREYVAASAATPVAAWASAQESRLGKAVTDGEVAEEEGEENMEFSADQVQALTSALDLEEGATDEDIVSAVKDLAAKAEKSVQEQEPIEAQARARGMKLVEAAAFDDMKAQVKKLTAKSHARTADDAVKAGKIMPASRDALIKQLDSGLITEDDVAGLEPIVTMAGRERGHAHGAEEVDDVRESDVYKNWKL